MKSYNGLAHRFNAGIVGRLTGIKKSILKRKSYILVSDNNKLSDFGYAGYINENDTNKFNSKNTVFLSKLKELEFDENDIVTIDKAGVIRFVWETKSNRNGIFVTDACNCKCIMCPQPPKPHESKLTEQNYAIINLIDKNYDGDICFTGGEPTTLGDNFLRLVKFATDSIPKASVSILTNAKALSDIEFVRKLALLGIKKLLLCVSLHADIDTLHDHIVGSKGSFRKTQLGLYNLARFGIATEIRVVVSKINYKRLPQLSEYIYRNYNFACHVTFMGLEMCGLAKQNSEQVWIDPFEYLEPLEKAVYSLHQRGMHVSSYNHQLCTMSPKIRSFGKKAISPWKNIYPTTCNNCCMKTDCCGFFSTSGSFISKHIKACLTL